MKDSLEEEEESGQQRAATAAGMREKLSALGQLWNSLTVARAGRLQREGDWKKMLSGQGRPLIQPVLRAEKGLLLLTAHAIHAVPCKRLRKEAIMERLAAQRGVKPVTSGS